MLYVVDSKTMKDIDNDTINEVGISSEVLMERAGIEICKNLEKYFIKNMSEDEEIKIIVVCGQGNNGADGMVTARILKSRGYQADIMLISEKLNSSAEKQLNIAKKVGVNVYNDVLYKNYNIIIDAMFGIGLSRNIEGRYKEEIQKINDRKAKYVLAIDIPSGISANDGKVMNIAVKANATVTFGLNKQGMILYDGCEYAGKVNVVDIGFPECSIKNAFQKNKNGYSYVYDKSNYKEYLPKRINSSNKGSYGKVLVIAGSKNMSGACYLAANAAYRSGAGLVKIITDKENRTILQSILAEAIIGTYDYECIEKGGLIEKYEKELLGDIEKYSSIVIGPGMGENIVTKEILKFVLENAKIPVVVDADGINMLGDLEIEKLPKKMVMTPHIREMSRYIKETDEFVKENKMNMVEYVKEYINKDEHILVLKDAKTVVFDKESRYINTSGNNGMSTGGSGDVLSGIIGAFLASGLNCMQAATIGVFVHGLAGDYFYKKHNAYSLLAKDIIESLKYVL